jgi:hypothetical protein
MKVLHHGVPAIVYVRRDVVMVCVRKAQPQILERRSEIHVFAPQRQTLLAMLGGLDVDVVDVATPIDIGDPLGGPLHFPVGL